MNKIVLLDAELCTGCGACVQLCPKKILRIDGRTGKCQCDQEDKCDRLRGCERVCPTGAILINARD